MSNLALLDARAEFHDRAGPSRTFLDYVRKHHIDVMLIGGFAGACGVLPIADCGGGRFDFIDHADTFDAFICEAYAVDGETVIDLVAWPIDRPDYILTILGRCGLLGAWEAMNPCTYTMGFPLTMHMTPLDWLQSGCRGAAVVTPHVAGRMLLDIPGRVAARNLAHGRALRALIKNAVPDDRIVIPARAA